MGGFRGGGAPGARPPEFLHIKKNNPTQNYTSGANDVTHIKGKEDNKICLVHFKKNNSDFSSQRN
jgi:hypothetical protein